MRPPLQPCHHSGEKLECVFGPLKVAVFIETVPRCRNADCVTYGDGMEFGEDKPQLFDSTQTARDASIGYEGYRFAVPRFVERIEHEFECRCEAVIIFRRDDDKGICRIQARGETLYFRMIAIMPGRQIEIERIDDIEVDQRVERELPGQPFHHPVADPALTYASVDDADFDGGLHILPLLYAARSLAYKTSTNIEVNMETSSSTNFSRLLTVGEVAERSGLAVSALHFYEAKGLISSMRSRGNQRRYGRDVLRRLGIIKVAQRVGIPLAEIQAAFDMLPQGRTPTAGDWQKLSQTWKDDLDTRIKRLTLLRDRLTGCIGCGCLSIESCPLRNPCDKLGKEGTGARLLEET